MTISKYALERLRLDRELRRRSRVLAFGHDALRHAQIMALLVLLLDLTPWAIFEPGEASRRAFFVLGWALLMATFYLLRPAVRHAPLEKLDRDAST